ncbi:MAG TPA: hypothetical protein VD993_10515 [Chitinophagaceae bacterium]|nr:hypothetical protein [Chitinophagaceae bacterium]
MKRILYLAVLVLAATACNKEERPVQSAVSDARAIRLKEMVSEGLPSPYFHFTYDNNNFITKLQHASGLLQYDLHYENSRLVSMVNNTMANKDTLQYYYADNRVSRIDLIEANGTRTKTAELHYDDQQRLHQIVWKKMNADYSASIIRKLVFRYNQQNISQFQDYRSMGNGLELLKTHYFEQYDDKVNVESNFLVKDVFEHFLFLPQVQLQKNNPLSEKIVGQQNDWHITYNYTFHNGLPATKTAEIRQTRGVGSGDSIMSVTSYNY